MTARTGKREGVKLTCPMCGAEFDPARAASACGACKLRRGCGLLRCPNCGYEQPPPSRLGEMLRRTRVFFGRIWRRNRGSQ